MNTAVAVIQGELMSAATLTSRLGLIQQAMQTTMKKGVDYGKVPGTQKPTLLKPGAEKLCAMFHIAPDYETEDLSSHDCVRIRVKCIGKQQGSECVLGSGVGECSTEETKYKWRKPVCSQEYDETPDDRKRSKWMIGKGKAYRATQVRTEPADLANTVLKMAAKRAHVAMVLNVTGATAIFTQDLEDDDTRTPPHRADDYGVDEEPSAPDRRAPQARSNAQTTINEAQLRTLQTKMDQAGMTAEQLCKRFGVESIAALQFNDLNTALAYVADPQMNEAR